MINNVQDLPTQESIARDGAIYNRLTAAGMRLYYLEAALRGAIPGLEDGSDDAIAVVRLAVSLIGEEAEKLDQLANQI